MLALERLDQSVKSDDQLAERTGLVAIGHVPYVAAERDRREDLVVLADPQSPVSEAYKALRTNLLFSSLDNRIKTLVVTSSVPAEGKSRTAANLAVVLAQAGHPTLLVDADFRRPSQHRIFGRIRNLGLSNLIPAGHRLRVTLSTSDTPYLRPNTNPFAVALMPGSSIDLPALQS